MGDGSQRVTEAGELFLGAHPPSEKHAAVKRLFSDHAFHAAVQDARFDGSIDSLVEAAWSGDKLDRLLAAATIARVASALRGKGTALLLRLASGMQTQMPDAALLNDPDDRAYVYKVLASTPGDWALSYAADRAVREDSAENARAEAIRALGSRLQNLDAIIEALTSAFVRWQPQTESPIDSWGRRLRRVLDALTVEVSASWIRDPAWGPALARMVRPPPKLGEPESEVAQMVAEATFAVVDRSVRSRFSISTEPAAYEAIESARLWFARRPSSWTRFVKTADIAHNLAETVLEAIRILALQSRPDVELRATLDLILGDPFAAKRALLSVAQQPGLSEIAQDWLRGSAPELRDRGQTAFTRAAESREGRDQVELGLQLRDATAARGASEHTIQVVIPELAILAPNCIADLEHLLARIRALIVGVEQFGTKRGLILRGRRGEVVEFSPLEHELRARNTPTRWVRYEEPAVLHVRPDGSTSVVLKAIVETADRPE